MYTFNSCQGYNGKSFSVVLVFHSLLCTEGSLLKWPIFLKRLLQPAVSCVAYGSVSNLPCGVCPKPHGFLRQAWDPRAASWCLPLQLWPNLHSCGLYLATWTGLALWLPEMGLTDCVPLPPLLHLFPEPHLLCLFSLLHSFLPVLYLLALLKVLSHETHTLLG